MTENVELFARASHKMDTAQGLSKDWNEIAQCEKESYLEEAKFYLARNNRGEALPVWAENIVKELPQ